MMRASRFGARTLSFVRHNSTGASPSHPALAYNTPIQAPLSAVLSLVAAVVGGGVTGFYFLSKRIDSVAERIDSIDSTLKALLLIGPERDKYVSRKEAEAFFAGKQRKEIGEGGSEEQASAGTA
ncbi:hypothetical protein Rhopal_003542-T1 [Rhodotorula paludigena]|uniref:Uncharacterized protein n=1 Tax=Rhodotorula paludigena TaxID=86838 RepID=A0AAV5GDM1_9BASI|nr:hypothetical protein Rhopal_003542-T1 [Rhodotorula paludigena]